MGEKSPSRTLARSGLRGSAPDRSCGQVDALPLESGPTGPVLESDKLGPITAARPDQERFCRLLPREIIQVLWLPSPAFRNGEWIVMRVVGGHYGGRRGFFCRRGRRGPGFPSAMWGLPHPP